MQSLLDGWRVGATDDPAEREADRMAAAMVASSPSARVGSRRAPAAPRPERIGLGDGHPLDATTARRFHPHVGDHIRHVRVHTGPMAAAAARAVGARAFTAGDHVVFGAGTYAPETHSGRRLIAHELAHVIQNADARAPVRVLRRDAPRTRDPIHAPLIEEYRREHNQPPGGIDPETGQRVGPTDAQLKYGGGLTPPAAMNLASCGVVTPGMPPARGNPIIACINHVRFVNLMDRAIANMARVPTPYAPGLAALYRAVLAQVIAAGTGTTPTPTAARDYTITGSTLGISAGVSLPLASFTLRLEQSRNPENGVLEPSGVLRLNETSGSATQAAVMNDPAAAADVERTMYHEGIHLLSGEVSRANRLARAARPRGRQIAPALDEAALLGQGEPAFRAAVTPIWNQIVAAVPRDPGAPASPDARVMAGQHWFIVNAELLAWLEEEIYLRARRGLGFGRADLATFTPAKFFDRPYWDRAGFFQRAPLETFLRTNRSSIETQVMPAVRSILERVLAARPPR